MCIERILQDNAMYKRQIQRLKDMSEYYPIIKQDVSDGSVFLTTLVRIERDSIWYTVHCVESFIPTSPSDFVTAFKTMIAQVHRTQYLYMITGTMEDLDVLQQSEVDRLREEQAKIHQK